MRHEKFVFNPKIIYDHAVGVLFDRLASARFAGPYQSDSGSRKVCLSPSKIKSDKKTFRYCTTIGD